MSLVDAYEKRLALVSDYARSLLFALLLFAVALAVSGLIRALQMERSLAEIDRLTTAIGASWAPIEPLYSRSFDLMAQYAAEHSTPWSQVYLFLSISYIAFIQAAPSLDNPTMSKTLADVGELGNRLHDYNSDVRQIAAAQRRGLPFEQLSKADLQALVRIFAFKLTPRQVETMEKTAKLATVALALQEAGPESLRFAPHVKNLLVRFSGGVKFSEVTTNLMLQDLRATGRSESTSPEFIGLRGRIVNLPGQNIAQVEDERDEARGKVTRLNQDAGVDLPFLGVMIKPAHLLVGSTLVNAVLLIIFVTAIRRMTRDVGRWQDLAGCKSVDEICIAFRIEIVSTSWPRRLLYGFLLLSPSIAAASLFVGDTADDRLLATAVAAALVSLAFTAVSQRSKNYLPIWW